MTAALAMITCPVEGCGHTGHYLAPHLSEVHGMDAEGLPAEQVESAALQDAMKVSRKAPDLANLKVKFGRYEFPINANMREEDCLPAVPFYFLPKKGRASRAHVRAVRALRNGEPCYIYGGPGTGKDSVIQQFCAVQRKPSMMLAFTRGTDVKGWFYKQKIDAEGTGYQYGALWHALTKGVEGRDGVREPILVCFSDVDRGDEDQLEEFRLVLDTTSGRILDPLGKTHKILPGTQFVFTANSNGNGADGMSSRPIDGSLIDRMGEFIQFHHMNWSEECGIYRSIFSEMNEACPDIFDDLGKSVTKIRALLEEGDLFCTSGLSMRGIQSVLKCADAVREEFPNWSHDKLLKEGWMSWLDRLDEDNRDVAKAAINEALRCGTFDDDEDEEEGAF